MKPFALLLLLALSVVGLRADSSYEATVGETLTISANIGTPPEGKTFGTYTIKWFKDGKAFSSATTLTVTVRGQDEAGVYSFVFSNSAGSITSDLGTVTVKPAAPAVVLPKETTVGIKKK